MDGREPKWAGASRKTARFDVLQLKPNVGFRAQGPPFTHPAATTLPISAKAGDAYRSDPTFCMPRPLLYRQRNPSKIPLTSNWASVLSSTQARTPVRNPCHRVSRLARFINVAIAASEIGWPRYAGNRKFVADAEMRFRTISCASATVWSRGRRLVRRPPQPVCIASAAKRAPLFARKLLHQRRRGIDGFERFLHRSGRNDHGTVERAVVTVIAAERVDIAVEGGADHGACLVDHR